VIITKANSKLKEKKFFCESESECECESERSCFFLLIRIMPFLYSIIEIWTIALCVNGIHLLHLFISLL